MIPPLLEHDLVDAKATVATTADKSAPVVSTAGATLEVVHGGGGCISGCGPFVKMREHPAIGWTDSSSINRAAMERMVTLPLISLAESPATRTRLTSPEIGARQWVSRSGAARPRGHAGAAPEKCRSSEPDAGAFVTAVSGVRRERGVQSCGAARALVLLRADAHVAYEASCPAPFAQCGASSRTTALSQVATAEHMRGEIPERWTRLRWHQEKRGLWRAR